MRESFTPLLLYVHHALWEEVEVVREEARVQDRDVDTLPVVGGSLHVDDIDVPWDWIIV